MFNIGLLQESMLRVKGVLLNSGQHRERIIRVLWSIAVWFISPVAMVWLSLFFTIFSPSTVLAQQTNDRIYFERVGENGALSSSHIAHLYEDSGGFIWIGTSNGLYRYDGFQFKIFRSDPQRPEGLSTDFIRRITGDDQGRIWVISEDDQVHRYEDPNLGFQRMLWSLDSTQSGTIHARALQFVPRRGMWLIAKGQGLLQINPQTNVLEQTGLPVALAKKASHLAVDKDQGIVWILADDVLYQITRLSRNKDELSIQSFPKRTFSKVNALLPDQKGGVWVAGYMPEIFHLSSDLVTLTAYPYKKEGDEQGLTALNRVNTLCMDEQGHIWAGTNHAGIVLIDPISRKMRNVHYERSDERSLSSQTVTSIIRDRSGIIWVAHWGGGVQKYVPGRDQFRHFPSMPELSNSLSDPVVSTFYEDQDGVIWIGTRHGLNRFERDAEKISRYFLPQDPGNGRRYEIYSIQGGIGGDRSLWIGTDVGLWKFDPLSGRFTRWRSPDGVESPLERTIIYYLRKDKNGALWAVSYWPYRLFQLEIRSGLFKQIQPLGKMVLSGEPVYIADQQDNVWIGTEDQVFYRYHLTEQQLYPMHLHPSDSSGFNTQDLGHFYKDPKGTLWVGTTTGLYEIPLDARGQPLPARRYTDLDGLPSNQVYGILADETHLWLSTNRGLARFNPDKRSFSTYTAKDGLQADEFGFGSFLKSPASGALLFGGSNGFNLFFPQQIKKDPVFPLVSLTGIQVLAEEGTRDIAFNPLKAARIPAEIRLTHDDKVITIYFAALHFADPARNQFVYRMDGFDKAWRYAGQLHQATYTNMDPGKYTFRVKACNKDGIWNETGASLSIRVLPPWWWSWWAFALYAGLIATGLYTGLRFERRRHAERSEALRMAELDAVKTRLYTNITHEFRTPLTVISGMADLVEQPAEARDLIKRNAASLLHLVNQILDLARLEAGRLSLDLVLTDIVPFLRTLTDSFRTYAEVQGTDLIFYSESTSLTMDMDTQKMFSIGSNLLSNAIKFSETSGQILVHLREEPGVMVLKVRDQGKGIRPEQIPFIFDRFYQADDASMRAGEGSGIGLTLTKELVELMGGTITVKSEPDKGSEFTITLPITRRADPGPVGPDKATITSPTWINLAESQTPPPGQVGDQELPLLLIIEDNSDVATYLRQALGDRYNILFAKDGESGVEQAIAHIPDVIISDIMMPGMDGYVVCRTLKQDERTCHIPIILLTARADMDSRLEGLGVGADAYLAKPFSREELLIRLQKLRELRWTLQRHYAQQTPVVDHTSNPNTVLSLDETFLKKIGDILEAHFADEGFGNVQLASRLHISESQLFRKLKALTGQSTALFIRSYRLHKGKEKLENTQLTVSEIAYEVGFSDPAYFSRTFAQEFGVSPNAIRNK